MKIELSVYWPNIGSVCEVDLPIVFSNKLDVICCGYQLKLVAKKDEKFTFKIITGGRLDGKFIALDIRECIKYLGWKVYIPFRDDIMSLCLGDSEIRIPVFDEMPD